MKLRIIISTILFSLIWSCGQDEDLIEGCTDHLAVNFEPEAVIDDCECTYEYFSHPGPPPATAVKNIMLEPGSDRFKNEIDQFGLENPGRVFILRNASKAFLDPKNPNVNYPFGTRTNSTYYTGVLVDRILGDTVDTWEQRVNRRIASAAKAEVSIQSKINEEGFLTGLISVHFKEDALPEGGRVYIYLMADYLTSDQKSYERRNYSLNIIGNHEIPPKALKGEGVFTRMIKIDLERTLDTGAWNWLRHLTTNIRLVAFITDGASKNVVNSNGVPAGSNIRWNNLGDF